VAAGGAHAAGQQAGAGVEQAVDDAGELRGRSRRPRRDHAVAAGRARGAGDRPEPERLPRQVLRTRPLGGVRSRDAPGPPPPVLRAGAVARHRASAPSRWIARSFVRFTKLSRNRFATGGLQDRRMDVSTSLNGVPEPDLWVEVLGPLRVWRRGTEV